jgi:putative transposase
VLKNVHQIRQQMPRIGTRKLQYLLTDTLQRHGISIGRNKLFDLLADHGMLVRRRKRKRISTTNSNHPFRKYPNLVRELQVQRPGHLWVSDITYISLADSFCYLSLVTDAYSRKIVGYCLHPTLKKEGPLQALKMAVADKVYRQPLIHHSDRGLQYCCGEYITLLERSAISISMTEKGDPYENAIAERVNGILKSEFALDTDFESFNAAKEAVDKAITTYNDYRPHSSCNYLTPSQAHLRQGVLPARWKKRLTTGRKCNFEQMQTKTGTNKMAVNQNRDYLTNV